MMSNDSAQVTFLCGYAFVFGLVSLTLLFSVLACAPFSRAWPLLSITALFYLAWGFVTAREMRRYGMHLFLS